MGYEVTIQATDQNKVIKHFHCCVFMQLRCSISRVCVKQIDAFVAINA